MLTRSLARARREHRVLLRHLSRAERVWLGRPGATRPSLRRAALPRLLDTCERGIVPHLAAEETVLYPHLHAHLPEDTGTLDAALREHDTLREVMGLLRQRAGRFIQGEPGTDVDIAVSLRDLIQLWRRHSRRVDGVIAPLMRGWPEARHG